MKCLQICLVLILLFPSSVLFSSSRTTITLNGSWQFEQTRDAFPPEKFTRTIPVPGLVHLAVPRIDQYEKLYAKSKHAELKSDHEVLDVQYEPRYSWYRKTIVAPKEMAGRQAVLTLKKSKYVTQVFFNGKDAGTSMECYTPIEFPVTKYLRYGQENEILIRVGERVWLPSPAAGSTDKEKVNYIPGIWDDVELSFTGVLRLHKTLVLPSARENKVTVKLLIRNFHEAQQRYGDQMEDRCRIKVTIIEKLKNEKVKGPFETSIEDT